jgi:GT2 family glycosyltransferase
MILCILNHYNPSRNPFVEAVTCVSMEALVTRTVDDHRSVLIDGSGFRSEILEDLCSRLGAEYVCPEKVLTFAEGYNLGLNHAHADWYALCASDVIVPAGWDTVMIQEAKRCCADSCAPYLSSADYRGQVLHLGVRCKTFEPVALTFNLNLLSRALIESVGLLDGRFSGCFNDVDYLLRTREAGFRTIICNAGDVVHLGRVTVSASSTVRYDKDAKAFLAKYPDLETDVPNWSYNLTHPSLFPRRLYYFVFRFALKLTGNSVNSRLTNLVERFEAVFSRI